MPATKQPLCPCGKPVSGASLCSACSRLLERTLLNIWRYAAELDTVLARLARIGDRQEGGRGHERPLPLDLRASEAEWVATDTLTAWANLMVEEGATGTPNPGDTYIGELCSWLLSHMSRIRVAVWGPDCLDELRACELQIRRLIDRPADRWFAGPCVQLWEGQTCGAELFAWRSRGRVTCRACGATYDMEGRRRWLLAQAEDRLETASVIARAVKVLGDHHAGERQIVDLIRIWATRKRITQHGHLLIRGRQRPLYRIGDVLDLLALDAARRSA